MTVIVAEIGVNFDSIREAEAMIELAARMGADAVKFQVYNEKNIYDVFPSGDVLRDPKYEQLMKIMLDKEKLQHLKNVADDAGIEFFATPMFIEAVDWLNEIGVERFKIRYADVGNKELITRAINTGKQVIVSCGFIDTNNRAWTFLDNVLLMYCIPEYPPKVVVMPQTFNAFEGYSNHLPLVSPPLLAAARGAKIVEVHVKQGGTKPIDNAVSITFPELAELVRLVREIEEVIR